MSFTLLTGQDFEIPYRIKVSKFAKRITIRIRDEVVVTIPNKSQKQEAHSFVADRANWILANYKPTSKYKRLKPGNKIVILNEEYTIEHIKSARPTPKVKDHGNVLYLFATDPEADNSLKALSNYLRKSYGPTIKTRAIELAEQYQFKIGKISIRDQRSRWGSCSSRGNLNFNWRLIFAPIAILDYVIIHELCHTVHMNHSQEFWQLVSRYDTQYQNHRKWLKTHHNSLLEY